MKERFRVLLIAWSMCVHFRSSFKHISTNLRDFNL